MGIPLAVVRRMLNRGVWVGVVLLLVSVISYGLVQMTEARPAHEQVYEHNPAENDIAADIGGISATAVVVVQRDARTLWTLLDRIPDVALLLTTGATLLVIASRVRHHTS
jgi:hypothetical protein